MQQFILLLSNPMMTNIIFFLKLQRLSFPHLLIISFFFFHWTEVTIPSELLTYFSFEWNLLRFSKEIVTWAEIVWHLVEVFDWNKLNNPCSWPSNLERQCRCAVQLSLRMYYGLVLWCIHCTVVLQQCLKLCICQCGSKVEPYEEKLGYLIK